MATATKRKTQKAHRQLPKADQRSTAKQGASRKPARKGGPADDIEEPDRSAPALAEVDADALEFIEAIDRFKKQHGRPFPSWSEVLLVLRQLGYRRG